MYVVDQHGGSLWLPAKENRKLHHIYILYQHGGSLRLPATENRKLHHIYVLYQQGGSLRLPVTENMKLHHIYVLYQHGGSLRLAVTENRKLHHIYVLYQHGGWGWAVIGNKVLHPTRCSPNAGTRGGGRTRTVKLCSQASSLANEHQLASALPHNTTQAADSVTFSWMTLVK